MTIYKYTINLDKAEDVTGIGMPASARVLSVGNQNEKLCVWALVDPESPVEIHYFRLAGTGHTVEPEHAEKFLGTVQFADGKFVLHVFDLGGSP